MLLRALGILLVRSGCLPIIVPGLDFASDSFRQIWGLANYYQFPLLLSECLQVLITCSLKGGWTISTVVRTLNLIPKMPLPLSDEKTSILLKRFKENDTTGMASQVSRFIETDVFIAGSGPIAYCVPYSILIVC
jgi:hypothetical protein